MCVGFTRYHTQTNGDINVKFKGPSHRKTGGPFHSFLWCTRDQKQRLQDVNMKSGGPIHREIWKAPSVV